MSNSDIVKEEMEALIDDIKATYEASGKKVSGEFANGLAVTYSLNGAVLEGYAYLAGRAAGRMPPVENILAWVQARGIQPSTGTQTGLAWAIAKKIAREGTNKEYHLKIYEQVVTPERIQTIIDKVVSVNVQEFVNNVTAEMKLLTNNL
tara:strand:+ start:1079 stop:1525 length:447 start_codon:yes stop_codon:yes gene_type:complete